MKEEENRKFGGARRDRTADLLRATQALSQLSYSPVCTVVRIMPALGCRLNQVFNVTGRCLQPPNHGFLPNCSQGLI